MAVPASFEVNDRMKQYQISREAILNRSFLDDSVPAVDLSLVAKEPFLMLKNITMPIAGVWISVRIRDLSQTS